MKEQDTTDSIIAELQRSLFTGADREMYRIRQQMEKDIEYALRNLITPPIRGEITSGKIRWRGVKNIVFKTGDIYPIGLMQRGNLILFKKD